MSIRHSLRLIFFRLRSSARRTFPLMMILFAAEFIFFWVIRLIGGSGREVSVGTMYRLFTAAPLMFYIIPLIIPLEEFLRSSVGREACFARTLPVLPDTLLSAMIICTVIWSGLAEVCRTTISSFSLSMMTEMRKIGGSNFSDLVFSPYGAAGYTLMVTRNILAVVFVQLYISMVVLLASMSERRSVSRRRGRLLASIYGTIGGVLISAAFVYLTAGDGGSAESSETAFIIYVPQVIFLGCFIVLFGIVSAFILKHGSSSHSEGL